jgi:hypothetical protein
MADRSVLGDALRAAGLVVAGMLLAGGLVRFRQADRTVVVKGVAERDVIADLAIWPIRLAVGDNDLSAANAALQRQVRQVKEFLAEQGLDSSQVTLQEFVVNDAQAEQYGDPGRRANRFVIRQTLVVRSSEPDKVALAAQRVERLVAAGVAFTSGAEYGGGGPTFVFTQLNALKPEMIAESTARAREGAEQFARDSKSTLGGIRRASQGLFEILPRDPAPGISEGSQVAKRVRVVSTVEYVLED